MAGLLQALRRAGALMATMLTACGPSASASPGPSCSSRPPPPPPSVAAAPVTAGADRGQVVPGDTVTFTVTATGPARIHFTECNAALRLIIIDSSQLHVFSGSAVSQQDTCPELILAAGQTQSVTAAWPVDSTLPGGVYTALLILGDAPQLTLAIAVGASRDCR